MYNICTRWLVSHMTFIFTCEERNNKSLVTIALDLSLYIREDKCQEKDQVFCILFWGRRNLSSGYRNLSRSDTKDFITVMRESLLHAENINVLNVVSFFLYTV